MIKQAEKLNKEEERQLSERVGNNLNRTWKLRDHIMKQEEANDNAINT